MKFQSANSNLYQKPGSHINEQLILIHSNSSTLQLLILKNRMNLGKFQKEFAYQKNSISIKIKFAYKEGLSKSIQLLFVCQTTITKKIIQNQAYKAYLQSFSGICRNSCLLSSNIAHHFYMGYCNTNLPQDYILHFHYLQTEQKHWLYHWKVSQHFLVVVL